MLTLHHIEPVRDGGATTVENGALITRQEHDRFNILEQRYPELARKLNYLMSKYKGNYPEDVQEIIDQAMSLIEIKEKKKGRSKVKEMRR